MLERLFSHLRYRFFDYRGKQTSQPLTNNDHLRASLEWFRNSLLPEGGAAANYMLMMHHYNAGYPMATAGWVPVLSRFKSFYPETYQAVFQDPALPAELMNWVLLTQRRDGTFPASFGDFMNQPPRVFNNGKIILSLLDFYNAQNDASLVEAAIKSADWLLQVQSPDGSWRQFTDHQLTSNTYTASALIRLAQLTGAEKYREAGEKYIRFVLGLQMPNGYFKGNGFDFGPYAFTLTIAYAIAGLLEAGILTGHAAWIQAASGGLTPVLDRIGKTGFLPGEMDEQFESTATYSCLPGNCLLATTAYKLASLNGSPEFSQKADLLTEYVKSKQIQSKVPQINGGISGSWPVNGNYCSFEIPSWATSLFCETLMAQDSYH